ncbi:MAG: restriction endonuclease subunit S [Schleiferiaceae bacterium]|nr:restriction endonuclease subunit S [Schleiferiaceae bacterium]
MKMKLSHVGQCHFGLYAKPTSSGNIPYLQAKHFDDWGHVSTPIDTCIPSNGKTRDHLLEDGDVLLAGKGLRRFAWTYTEDFGPAIASSIFFVIKPDPSRVVPQFLALLLNLPESRSHFQTLGAGSSVPSIRKSELLNFALELPPLPDQERMVRLKELHDQDLQLSHKIIDAKRNLFEAMVKKLIS